MRKVFITVLLLATMLTSAAFAQTSQVSYYNAATVPLFQGTLAYQDGFSYESLANYIISSDEAYYSAQYYGERTDSPQAIKLAVLDNYVVWQFEFVDQVICIDAQNATNAYALPVDGVAYTYIIDDFSYDNAVYTDEVVSYANNDNAGVVIYDNTVQGTHQENYNISSGGYTNLYGGYATYEEYIAAYTASAYQTAIVDVVEVAPVVSSYSEIIYLGSANTPKVPSVSTVSIKPILQSPAVVGPVENLGIVAITNTIGSDYTSEYNHDGYDEQGYDEQGYDAEGYDREGYDREGYDREGYNREGFDREGYNRDGYAMNGYDREGYNSIGLNAAGYNRQGKTQ